MAKLPRNKNNDYSQQAISDRQHFIAEQSGVTPKHVSHYSIDPETLKGNIEHFTGVAQVPIGFAGPLLVKGEHIDGEVLVPMATTEGTLVASYNRGMRLSREAGGITTTVIDDAMQRAPMFSFSDARYARAFRTWLDDNLPALQEVASRTTSVGQLTHIEHYSLSKMVYTRCNFTCGDAAGQNMVTKATRAICQYIIEQNLPGYEHYALAANFDTDKKFSILNNLHTRGKRVVAEVTLPKQLVTEVMHTTPEALYKQRQYSIMGAFMAGAASNGAHFANGITAMFIACGQDVANVAESASGFTFAEIKPNGDYYFSVTLPSLIVASYGGGTGLATQKECLDILGCYGQGKVNRLAEIVAATVLCGELSLASAVVSDQWVSSHEAYGRNRP